MDVDMTDDGYEVIEESSDEGIIKLIFETYKDASTQYEMVKIRQNDKEIDALINYLKDYNKIKVLGLFGLVENIQKPLEMYLDLSNEVSTRFVEKMNKTEEGMFALAKEDRLLFAYKSNQNIFKTNSSINMNSLLVDYIRDLTDLCEAILIIPGQFVVEKPLLNPFRDKKTHSVSLFERTIQPHETIKMKKLNVLNSEQFDYVLQSNDDHSNILWNFKVDSRADLYLKKCNIENKKVYGSGFFFISSEFYDFKSLCKIIINNWDDTAKFEKLENLLYVFEKFIPNDTTKDAKSTEISNYIDEMKTKYINEVRSLYDVYIKEKFDEKDIEKICKSHLCDHCNTSNTDSNNNKSDNVEHIKHKTCVELGKLINELSGKFEIILNCFGENKDLLSKYIKTDSKNKIRNLMNDYKGELKTIEKFKYQLTDLRKQNLEKMLQFVSEKIEPYNRKQIIDFKISFYEVSVIHGTDSDATGIKLTKKPFNFKQQVFSTTSYDTTAISADVQVFLDNKCLAMLRNIPKEKSTAYVFELDGNKNDDTEIYSSVESHVIVDSRIKIYLVYDNVNRKAYRGKVNAKSGTLQPPTIIHNLYHADVEAIDGNFKLEFIKCACFLPGSDVILIIDGNSNFIEYNHLSGTLKLVMKKINQGKYIEKQLIKPKHDNEHYMEVQVVPNGKCVLLRSQSTIDVYDLNWNCILNIEYCFEKFKSFKTFLDLNSSIVLIIQDDPSEKLVAYELQGFSATRTLDIKYSQKEETKGFLLLDCFYMIQRKFGYQSKFIGSPSKQKLYFLIQEANSDEIETLETYFGDLKIKNIRLDIEELNSFDYKGLFNKIPTLTYDTIDRIIRTRIPIHIATIESSNIFPLQNGRNIYDQITSWTDNENNSDTLIEHIVSLIELGSFENILLGHKSPVKVIAIVGRQSGGKSYLLNRLTGTRFNVASTRCTDGIWMSLAYLENQLFVVCDCEGLFSIRRNDLEETKLCLTLCAVCDVLILNQDLSFNRYLNQLFSNFAKSCDRVSGKSLFKGTLMVVIRDVSSQDADGAYVEMISNIKQNSSQSKNPYLEKLFDGKIKGQCLHNFENDVFNEEIDDLRKWLLEELKPKWSTGYDFLDTLKFVMAQVHTDDDTFLDARRFKKLINQKEREAITMFMTGSGDFSKCESLIIKFEESICDSEVTINQNEINFTSFTDEQQRNQYLIFDQILANKINLKYKKDHHNDWLKLLNHFTKNLIEHRKNFVLKHITENLNYDASFEEEVENFKFTLKNKLDELMQNCYLCERKCRLCERVCVLSFSHNNDCSCETDHLCCNSCEICPSTKQAVCSQRYGHTESNHICSDGHVCGHKCEISEECKFTCNLSVNHEDIMKHDCKNTHRCKAKCSMSHCNATCAFDLEKGHKNHVCGLTTCDAKCSFEGCTRNCKFPNHNHDAVIKQYNKSRLEDLNELKCADWTGCDLINYHVCSEEHSCNETCEIDGVCTIGFNIIEKVWTNDCNSFPYKFYEPAEHRDKCIVKVPLYAKTHAALHDCKKGAEHRCKERCPECKSFCRLPVNHEEKYHETNTHRNKECNVFVSKLADETINVKVEGVIRKYEVGESCKPEICSESCERRGKGHFHLIECPGEESCPGKFSIHVKHSSDIWNPYPGKKFDLWQCEQYWHSLGWKPPVSEEIVTINRGCSFYCGHPDHDDKLSFCTKTAWHTDDHAFECVHNTYDSLELVFCCDTTGSMGSYIEQSKSTIRRIISELSEKVKNISIGFVAYRDHPPQDTTYVTLFNNLTDTTNILSFIDRLNAQGGGDSAEAVLDGLYDAIFKTTWSTKRTTMKYVVHIADAPPHGRIYASGSDDGWPDGCPCGNNLDTISSGLASKGIKYKLMKIGSYVNTMASIFKSKISSYEESELNGSVDLDEKVTSFLARDFLNAEVDLKVNL